jgi:hypothetical protein
MRATSRSGGRSLLVPEGTKEATMSAQLDTQMSPNARKFLEENTHDIFDSGGGRRDGDGLPAVSGQPLSRGRSVVPRFIAADHKYWWRIGCTRATLRRLRGCARPSSADAASPTNPTPEGAHAQRVARSDRA